MGMITRAARRQWAREFTLADAALCIKVLLPVGILLIAFSGNI